MESPVKSFLPRVKTRIIGHRPRCRIHPEHSRGRQADEYSLHYERRPRCPCDRQLRVTPERFKPNSNARQIGRQGYRLRMPLPPTRLHPQPRYHSHRPVQSCERCQESGRQAGSRTSVPAPRNEKLAIETAVIGSAYQRGTRRLRLLRSASQRLFRPHLQYERPGGDWPKNAQQFEGHSSDVITDRSLKWLKTRDQSKPFMLLHHFKAPHGPYDYAPRYESFLSDVDVPEPHLFEDGNKNCRPSPAEKTTNYGPNRLIGLQRHPRSAARGVAKDLSGDARTRASYQHMMKNTCAVCAVSMTTSSVCSTI